VVGTDALACKGTTTKLVSLNALPTVTATVTKTTICANDSVLFKGLGATSYLWENGIVDNAYVKLNTTASFIVTGTDANGCKSMDTVQVAVKGLLAGENIAFDSQIITLEDVQIITPINTQLVKTANQVYNYFVIISTKNGASTLLGDTLKYVPKANFNGKDTLVFRISDQDCKTDTAQVFVTVAPVNDAPVAVNNTKTTAEETAVVLTASATDADGDKLNITTIHTNPINGAIVINTDSTLTYTPNKYFNGKDTLAYVISDGNGGLDTVHVFVTVTPVNDTPVAVNDNNSITEGAFSVSEADGTGALIANDSDIDADALTVTTIKGSTNKTTAGMYGTLAWLANGSYTYTLSVEATDSLAEGQMVNDIFAYVVSDGNTTATANLTITITGISDAQLKDFVVSFDSIPSAVCLGSDAIFVTKVANAPADAKVEWSYINFQTIEKVTNDTLIYTGNIPQEHTINLKITAVAYTTFDTSFVLKVKNPIDLMPFDLKLNSHVGADSIQGFTTGIELFTCTKIDATLLDKDKKISFSNTDLSTQGNHIFTISDTANICSITDSFKIKLNNLSTQSLPLTVNFGDSVSTESPIALTNFGKLSPILSSVLSNNSALGSVQLDFDLQGVVLNYISISKNIAKDTVVLNLVDVCGNTKEVSLRVDLKNTIPYKDTTVAPLISILIVGQQLDVPITLLALDPNKNQTRIDVINESKFDYLSFGRLYIDTVESGLTVVVAEDLLPDAIRLGIQDTVHVLYSVCDFEGCSTPAIMVLRFEFLPKSETIKALDLTNETWNDIRKKLEIVSKNTAVSNKQSLQFKFLWNGEEIPNSDALSYELTILSRWGDVVYKEQKTGTEMEWFGEYMPDGNNTGEKVEEGNYFWIISIKYKNANDNVKNEFASGYLYYMNRDLGLK
jgi:VCBS repeat-containing protein